MHDNPQALPGRAFALPDHRVIALSGRDASAFAQAQLMNDLKLLAPGRWQWNGWLTPKGRVIALFALLKFDEETLWLLVPDADPVTLASALQRFVFRAKVAIAVRDDLHVEGAFALSQQARGNELAGDPASGVELDFSADAGPRTLRIVPDSTASHDAVWMQRWAAFDLAHGLPRLPASQSDHWTPQQLSLDRLNAFSVKKGCYPGQEIVARSQYLGKLKRRMLLASIDVNKAKAGMEVFSSSDPEQPCGMVVNAESNHQGGSDCLVEVKMAATEDGTIHLGSAAGPQLRFGSLPYPLPA
jgi:tRNA-modifying protein YgfZ